MQILIFKIVKTMSIHFRSCINNKDIGHFLLKKHVVVGKVLYNGHLYSLIPD